LVGKRPVIFLSLVTILLFTFGVFSSWTSEARYGSNACSALALEAMNQSATNCDGLSTNIACYGYNRVSVLFNRDVPEDLFSKPADRADLPDLQSIETSAYDQASDFWGVAVMKLQANIPNTLPGQSVTFILMGETQVADAVPPDQQLLPSSAVVAVAPTTRTNVRSKPSGRSNVLLAVNQGQELQADAIDESGMWLRVVANGVPGWISRAALGGPDVSSLPVITSETLAPMQAFYLKTKFGKPECAQAPSALLVQGPKNLSIDLSVNGASITIHSTVLFRTLDEDTMELLVLDGQAVVDGLTIPTGFRSLISLKTLEATNPELASLAGTVSVADGKWTDCMPITDDERAELQTLANIPASLLSYPVTIPNDVSGDCLKPGQSAFSTGQTTTQNMPGVDCRAFRPTSPLGGASYGPNTFYWDAAPGATSYRVRLYSADGTFAGLVNTGGAETSVSLDTAIAGSNTYSFSWEVEALKDGQVACTTNRITMALGAPPPPVQGQQGHIPPSPSPALTPNPT
jgi:hypothetical protein